MRWHRPSRWPRLREVLAYVTGARSTARGDVLVIARDTHRQALLAALFTLAGFRCVTAASTDEALPLTMAIAFDAVVVDTGRDDAVDLARLSHRGGNAPRLVAMTSAAAGRAHDARHDPEALVAVVQRLVS